MRQKGIFRLFVLLLIGIIGMIQGYLPVYPATPFDEPMPAEPVSQEGGIGWTGTDFHSRIENVAPYFSAALANPDRLASAQAAVGDTTTGGREASLPPRVGAYFFFWFFFPDQPDDPEIFMAFHPPGVTIQNDFFHLDPYAIPYEGGHYNSTYYGPSQYGSNQNPQRWWEWQSGRQRGGVAGLARRLHPGGYPPAYLPGECPAPL